MAMRDFDCGYQECKKPAHCRFLCKVHYELWLRHNNPEWAEKHNAKSRRYRSKNLKKVRAYNAKNMEARRRTVPGYLSHKYSLMLRRVKHKHRENSSWFGKQICKREEFVAWSLSDPDFHKVFDKWLTDESDARYWPSIDRIDNSLGYTIGNMRWTSHHKNVRS